MSDPVSSVIKDVITHERPARGNRFCRRVKPLSDTRPEG
jgi:hypothetical protein